MLHEYKAQASVEFLTMVGVVLIIFIGLLTIASAQHRSSNDTIIRFNLQRACNDFSTAINLASSGGNGFATHVTLPQTIKNMNYTVSINLRTVILTSGKRTVFCRLISDKVEQGNVTKGSMTLKNVNGTVYIETA